ncbi:MAG: D,D-heptose 1,7-bisphosphate phosphatase [Desulfuromonas sp.]|mgnify:CR=1 FL=1|nr:MAG: D,D-heptose 1,7-bisphosphate phosphatase [Desulfuromonas sp.]
MRTVSTPLRPAVFLDRDGTINRECHYLQRIDDFELLPGAPEALRKLQAAGFLLVVVTNQSGVARGYFSFETVTEINRHMQAVLAESGVVLDGIYVCPHHPTAGDGPLTRSCTCRKGSPGLLLQAAADLSIDLPRSWMVGDKMSDVDAGRAAGCRSLKIQPENDPETFSVDRGCCFDSLASAARYILDRG